jgi:hypothetical protein
VLVIRVCVGHAFYDYHLNLQATNTAIIEQNSKPCVIKKHLNPNFGGSRYCRVCFRKKDTNEVIAYSNHFEIIPKYVFMTSLVVLSCATPNANFANFANFILYSDARSILKAKRQRCDMQPM